MVKNKKTVSLKENINDLSKLALDTLEKNTTKSSNKKYSKIIKIEATKENSEIDDDEELLKLLVGKNIDKMDSNSFNFAAAIFNCSYFVYRKLYIIALLLFILIIGLKLLIVNNLIFFSVYVVICVACGVLFNKYYIETSKRKIEKIKLKYPTKIQYKKQITKYSKKNIVLPIIVETLLIGIISIIISGIKLTFIITVIISLVNSITTSDHKFLKMNSESFVNIVEQYNETAVMELDEPGEYTYIINGEKYSFVALPYNNDKKDIACSYKNKKWKNNKKYEFSSNSSTCSKYFKDIFNNYVKDYDLSTLTRAEIIITYKGKIANNSYLKYNDVVCKYEKSEFKCSR